VFQPFDGEIVAAFDPGQQGAADAGRVDPAARGEPPAALCHRPAGKCGGFLASDVAAELRRQRMRFDDGALAFLMLDASRAMCSTPVQPARTPGSAPKRQRPSRKPACNSRPSRPSSSEGRGRNTPAWLPEAPMAASDPLSITMTSWPRAARACAAAAPAMPAPITAMRRRTKVGDGDAAPGRLAASISRLSAKAGAPFRCEAGGREAAAHLAGDGPGGQRGTGRSQPPQLGDDVIAPQIGVSVGREAVEVDRIGGQRQLRQQVCGVTEAQRECRVAEVQPVQAGQRQGPLGEQFGGERRQFRPARQHVFQVGAAQGDASRRRRSASAGRDARARPVAWRGS
jgi:hypothetical protein